MENLNKDSLDFETYKQHVIGAYLGGLMLEERTEEHDRYASSDKVAKEIKRLYDAGVYSYDAEDRIADMFLE